MTINKQCLKRDTVPVPKFRQDLFQFYVCIITISDKMARTDNTLILFFMSLTMTPSLTDVGRSCEFLLLFQNFRVFITFSESHYVVWPESIIYPSSFLSQTKFDRFSVSF
jgi:hypothetical protein